MTSLGCDSLDLWLGALFEPGCRGDKLVCVETLLTAGLELAPFWPNTLYIYLATRANIGYISFPCLFFLDLLYAPIATGSVTSTRLPEHLADSARDSSSLCLVFSTTRL